MKVKSICMGCGADVTGGREHECTRPSDLEVELQITAACHRNGFAPPKTGGPYHIVMSPAVAEFFRKTKERE